MSAILTCPVPNVVSGTGGPAGAAGVDDKFGIEEMVEPEQFAKTAAKITPDTLSQRANTPRRVGVAFERRAVKSADTIVLLVAR
jgi:hypothetical protein